MRFSARLISMIVLQNFFISSAYTAEHELVILHQQIFPSQEIISTFLQRNSFSFIHHKVKVCVSSSVTVRQSKYAFAKTPIKTVGRIIWTQNPNDNFSKVFVIFGILHKLYNNSDVVAGIRKSRKISRRTNFASSTVDCLFRNGCLD